LIGRSRFAVPSNQIEEGAARRRSASSPLHFGCFLEWVGPTPFDAAIFMPIFSCRRSRRGSPFMPYP
jgi:hypothetical protein